MSALLLTQRFYVTISLVLSFVLLGWIGGFENLLDSYQVILFGAGILPLLTLMTIYLVGLFPLLRLRSKVVYRRLSFLLFVLVLLWGIFVVACAFVSDDKSLLMDALPFLIGGIVSCVYLAVNLWLQSPDKYGKFLKGIFSLFKGRFQSEFLERPKEGDGLCVIRRLHEVVLGWRQGILDMAQDAGIQKDMASRLAILALVNVAAYIDASYSEDENRLLRSWQILKNLLVLRWIFAKESKIYSKGF